MIGKAATSAAKSAKVRKASIPAIRIYGRKYYVSRIVLHKPPDWFIDRYRNLTEPHKRDMMSAFGEEVKQAITSKGENIDYNAVQEEIFQNRQLYILRYTRDGVPILDQNMIQMQFGLKGKEARYIKTTVERKFMEDMAEKREMEETRERLETTQLEQKLKEAQKQRESYLKRLPASASRPKDEEDIKREAQELHKKKLEDADEGLKDLLSSID